MNLLAFIYTLLRDVFAPGRIYSIRRRRRRVFVLSLLAGASCAVAFGLALYELNVTHRLGH